MQHEWRRAEESFRHATSLGAYTPAYRLLGDLLISLSRFEEAAQFLELAQQIDPFSYRQKVAYSRFLYMSRRFDRASAQWLVPSKYGSLPIETLLHAAHSLIQLRLYEEVLRLASDLELRARGSIVALSEIAEILALAGYDARAMNIVNSHKLLAETTPLSMVRRSLLLLALKDSAGAASCLRRAAERREPELYWLSSDPRFDSLRGDGFFSDVIRSFREVFDHLGAAPIHRGQ
jgi:tetratricopeptide (TPR) repeat protein